MNDQNVPPIISPNTLHGVILAYYADQDVGLISGNNSKRYKFKKQDWRGQSPLPAPGATVEFVADEIFAIDIFPSAHVQAVGKSRKCDHLIAGLLAIFLGCFGVHKFYMGYSQTAVWYLIGTVIGTVLSIVIVGLFLLVVIFVASFIEGIIYISMTQEAFEATYLLGKRDFF